MPRIETKLNIKNNIYARRLELNITQQDLADEVGVTRATIIAIEKESYNPSLELAFRLARYFDAKIEDLFFIKEK